MNQESDILAEGETPVTDDQIFEWTCKLDEEDTKKSEKRAKIFIWIAQHLFNVNLEIPAIYPAFYNYDSDKYDFIIKKGRFTKREGAKNLS